MFFLATKQWFDQKDANISKMNMICFFPRPELLLLFSGCEDGDRKETFLKHLGSIGSQKCDPFQPASKKESSFSQASIFQISRQVGCLWFIKHDAHTISRNLPPILTFGWLTERVAGYFQPNAKTIHVFHASHVHLGHSFDTLPETNIAPENPWLEDDISFWDGL